MVAATKYDIKPEYLKVPSVRIPTNRFFLRLISYLMVATRLFFRWDKRVDVKVYRITGRDGNSIKVIRVQPKTVARKASTMLYYHGGAFCLSYASLHLQHVQEYALAANSKIFIVDYRLSYSHPFPAALHDCYDALAWVQRNATMLGVNRERIVVGGDSAGGALAASVAQMARDIGEIALKAQVLIYPVTDASCSSKSATRYTDTPLFRAEDNKSMWRTYLRGSTYENDVSAVPEYASPMHCGNFKGLPEAYIESAQYDPLCDEAHHYAEKLQAAGVKVQLLQTKGTIHGYDFQKSSATTQKYYKLRTEKIVSCLAS